MKNKLISISIDDGHPLDLKAAEKLAKKNIQTTFYIPIKNSTGRPTLNRKQIKWLSQQPHFKIGGHTYNHVDLTKISLIVAEKEIVSGKEALEDIIGEKISTFAFPWGKYTRALVDIVNRLGFLDCRSATTLNLNEVNKSGFLWHPNLHIFPHPWYRGIVNALIRKDIKTVRKRYILRDRGYIDLIQNIKQMDMPIHFWFHSWEIEKIQMWNIIDNL
ncbi:MAG: polysaccharide deacetylase family protein [bacterium]